MKNQSQSDILLRLAWLEGLVNTHGAYERAVARRTVKIQVSLSARATLIHDLESVLESGSDLTPPLTVGALLRRMRSSRHVKPHEVFQRIGVSRNIYALLEQDAISPLKIPADVWRKLMALLNISIEEIADMLRRTHRLVVFRPAFGGMLARYKGKKGGKKMKTLGKAGAELYARADLPLPEREEKMISELLSQLRPPDLSGDF